MTHSCLRLTVGIIFVVFAVSICPSIRRRNSTGEKPLTVLEATHTDIRVRSITLRNFSQNAPHEGPSCQEGSHGTHSFLKSLLDDVATLDALAEFLLLENPQSNGTF